MSKIINSVKLAFKGIIWPKPKTVFGDTMFAIITTAILSTVIMLWITGIEIVVNFIISL